MVDIRELLEYNVCVRRNYMKALQQLPWSEFTENREASFHSMRNIFLHTLGAIDYWLDFLEAKNLRVKKKYDAYKNFDEVREYMGQVEKRMNGYFASLSKDGLKKVYAVKDDSGKIRKIPAEDILIHVFEEEVHHRGELIALLWQIGVEPPAMGWKGL